MSNQVHAESGATVERPATETLDSESWWDELPTVQDATTPTTTFQPLRQPTERQPTVGRRRFVQGAVVLAGAVSLNIVGAFSKYFTRPAAALSGWTNCTVYEGRGVYGQTPSEYVCLGAPYSYKYCTSSGWFKNSSSSIERYTPNESLCNGNNAWWWYHSNSNTASPRGTYRCSDGDYYYLQSGRWVGGARICSSFRSSSDITT